MAERLVYKRSDGNWAWPDNGAIIATDGAEGYNNEADCRTMADRVVEGYYKNAKKMINRG